MRKLKFYFIGLLPGLLIVFFILNKKGASCSGYLPNSRVIAETLSKEFQYSEGFKTQMQVLKINENYLKENILKKEKLILTKAKLSKNLVRNIYWFLLSKMLSTKLLLKNVKTKLNF